MKVQLVHNSWGGSLGMRLLIDSRPLSHHSAGYVLQQKCNSYPKDPTLTVKLLLGIHIL